MSIINHLAFEDTLHPMAKGIIEVIFHILTGIVLFLEIHSHFPPDPVIGLELAKSDTQSEYSLIGADSDQDYSLEYIKIYPRTEALVKKATFEYDYYTKEVKLTENPIEQPKAYLISRQLLQKEFGEEGFHFEFSEEKHLTFHFLLDNENAPQFECQAVAIKASIPGQMIKESVPCEVEEKNLLSSARTFYHYYGFGLLLFAVIVFWYIRFLTRQKTTGPTFG